MTSWRFTLEAGPLTTQQVDTLEAGVPGSAVTLSAYRDGMVQATVECDRIERAFAMARSDISDLTGKPSPRIIALGGELEGTVADVVFRAAENLRIDAAEVLLEHLALIWYREALEMAALGARDKQHYGSDGSPRRAIVVKPTPWNGSAASQAMTTWEAIYSAAKGYMQGKPIDGSEPRVLADGAQTAADDAA
jgi:hypothetical protein